MVIIALLQSYLAITQKLLEIIGGGGDGWGRSATIYKGHFIILNLSYHFYVLQCLLKFCQQTLRGEIRAFFACA